KVAGLARELVPALADECRREGLVFVGHLPAEMSVAEASNAGQRGIEHLDGVLAALSGRADRRESWWRRLLVKLHVEDPDNYQLAIHREILAGASPRGTRADSLYALLARNGTWQEPTLSELRDLHRV